MTNIKLPEIGKKYRAKHCIGSSYNVIVDKILDNCLIYCHTSDEINYKPNSYVYRPSYFWSDYAEIPDNSQPEVAEISKEDFEALKNMNSNETRIENFSTNSGVFNDIYKKVKEESKPNAVEEAIEELQIEMLWADGRNTRSWKEHYRALEYCAQKLINALEAEKAIVNPTIPQKPVSSIAEYTKGCEHGDKYPYDFNNGDEVEKRCYACAQEAMVLKHERLSKWEHLLKLYGGEE
jgi:hypothetical protein